MTRLTSWSIGLVAVVWTAATALTQVQPGERAIIRRFGRILADKPGPGLHAGWPWGIDRVDRIAVGKARSLRVGFTGKEEDDPAGTPSGQLLTGDHNLVNVGADIQFNVVEAEIDKFFLSMDRVDTLLSRAAEAVLAEWLAGRDVDTVLSQGRKLLPEEMVDQLQGRILPYDLGIQIRGVNITQLDPPEAVRDAFERVAQADSGRETQRNAAVAAAQEKLRGAESAIFRSKSQTAAYATSQTLQARAEARNFLLRLEQYRQLTRANPDYLNSLWLDEMTRLFARMQEAGRIDVLDHYLTGDRLSITQFPALPRKK